MLIPRRLANIIIHELGHAYSRYTGYFLNNYNKFGCNDAMRLDEIFSYQKANQYGVSY